MNPIKSLKYTVLKPKFLQYCITIMLPFFLSGCMGVYEGGFECPAGEGVGCKSISEVNDMINKGDLPNNDLVSIPTNECEDCSSKRDSSPQEASLSQEEPTLWIAPWALTETP